MALSPAPVAHVADLQRLIIRDPGRPRVTWYGDDGERVELSGAVLHNWINKTVNLLVEEFDAAPGTRVLLDLPPHWRAIVWALATWRAGATLVLQPDTSGSEAVGRVEDAAPPVVPTLAHGVDVVVTSRPAAWTGTYVPVVAVPLPALARRFDGDLPSGALDAGSAVMTYGDQIGWVEEIDPDAVALEPGAVRHSALIAWGAESGDDAPTSARALVQENGTAALLRRVLQVLGVDGSVVVVAPTLTAELDQDHERLDRLRTSERVDLG